MAPRALAWLDDGVLGRRTLRSTPVFGPDLPWPTVTADTRLRHLDGLEGIAHRGPNDPVGSAFDLVSAMRGSGRQVDVNPAVLEGRASSGSRDRKLAVIVRLREDIVEARG